MAQPGEVRLELKIAIVKSGKAQRRLASEIGITQNRLSEIVCGWRDPHDEEAGAILRALNRNESARAHLFGPNRMR